MAEVAAIHVAAEKGSPVTAVEHVISVAGRGLIGDRYFDLHPDRQITVVATDELDEAAAELGYPIPLGSTRRNVTVSGIRLPREAGSRLRLGEIVVEVHDDCAPCEVMETSVGPGARAALPQRAGIVGRIIQGGILRVGDPVSLVDA